MLKILVKSVIVLINVHIFSADIGEDEIGEPSISF